jgi:hypothetical protein
MDVTDHSLPPYHPCGAVSDETQISPRRAALIGLLICATAGSLSVILGPDNYWDLRFFHLYAPWAYLHGRYLYDVAPAQWSSFFNPTADFLFYGLTSSRLNEVPRVIAFIMGAVHGFNAVLVAAIAMHVVRPQERWERVTLCAAATLIGVSGAGFVSLLGTTSNDLVNSIFVLGALLGLLKIAGASSDSPAWRGFAGSGLSAGLGLGLKYTAAIFVPGLAVIALLAAARRRTAAGFVVFGVSGALGFLMLAGPHLLTLWRDFGNPVFPMLNNVFQSPYFDAVSWVDVQFLPRNVWQAIAYPFYWAKTNVNLVSEVPLRDWRGPAAYLAILVALVTCVVRLVHNKPRRNALSDTRGLGLVFIFVIISYLAWALGFGNYRYGVTLEILTGVVIMGALIVVMRQGPLRVGAAVVLLTIVAATTVYPDWGRGRYGDRTIDVRVPPLPSNSIVLISTGLPVAYFIPFAEPTAQFLGIENDFLTLSQHNGLVSEIKSLMRTPDRPKFVVSVGEFDRQGLNSLLAQFDLALSPSPCQPIWSNLENPALSLCPTVPR